VTQLADTLFTAKTPPESEPEARLVEAVRESALKAGLGEQEVEKNVAIYRAFVRTQAAEFNGEAEGPEHQPRQPLRAGRGAGASRQHDELRAAAQVAERRAEPARGRPEPGH
jgi:hypothetical protein